MLAVMPAILLPVLSLGALSQPPAQAVARSPFASKALSIVAEHPIVKGNAYTEWFSTGEASIDQAQVSLEREESDVEYE